MDESSQKNQEIIQRRDSKLKSFIEKLERLSKKKNNINFDIKEVFSEAKIMRKILALRNMDVSERLEQKRLLKTYKNALGIY